MGATRAATPLSAGRRGPSGNRSILAFAEEATRQGPWPIAGAAARLQSSVRIGRSPGFTRATAELLAMFARFGS